MYIYTHTQHFVKVLLAQFHYFHKSHVVKIVFYPH